MIARDVLFRGRGADIGVRASDGMVRWCGATLGVAIFWLADALGLLSIVGAPEWVSLLACLVAGATLGPSAFGAWLWLIGGLLSTTLMLVMFTPLVRGAIPSLVRADPPSATPVDAIVVLSGGLTDDGRINKQALDRLLTAFSTAKRRAVRELALSVVSQRDRTPPVTSEADQRALVQLVAPELSLSFVRNVHSTHDEALAFSALARTHQWRRIILITSALHTRRACAALENEGLQVECVPADGRDYSLNGLDRAGVRRLVFQDALYEFIGTALYRARGWVR